MYQNVFIIGATGNVGRTLVSQIMNNGDEDKKKHINPTRIVGLASSSNYLYSPEGLSKKICLDFSSRTGKSERYESLKNILEEVRSKQKDNLVFIDVTASNDITDFHTDVIEKSKFGMVTANKNPLTSCDYKTFQKLTERTRKYGYRCSVMAGAEAITFLQDLRDVNDPPKIIQGCFSGTLGYITSEFKKGRKISEIVSEAKAKGYTEPHPRDDLNGLDVAKKLLILARTSGHDVNMENITISPFIPKEYLSQENVKVFLRSIKKLDDDFTSRVNGIIRKGKVLRYVAKMDNTNDNLKLSVSLREVPKDSSLGSLNGTSNKITITSNTYSQKIPYSIEAPGAGLEVTAQNIRRDLLSQLEGRILSNA